MLSSFTRDLAGATDGHDALFLVEGLPEALGHAVVLHVLENLNERHTPRLRVNQTVVTFVKILINVYVFLVSLFPS